MAKNRYRRQVAGTTEDGKIVSVGRVSSKGYAQRNARAKGCFGNPQPRHFSTTELKK